MDDFNFMDFLNPISQAVMQNGAEAWEPTLIPLDKIVPSPKNVYGIRGIEELAASIEMTGLYHNLTVRRLPDADVYEIVSGERRYRALKLLVEQGLSKFSLVPCKVETEQDDTLAELKLFMANSTARELTGYEKTIQQQRLYELLSEVKKNGAKLTGRRREIVAKMLEVSSSQVARMESINKHLVPEAKAEFQQGNMDITTAYETSRLPVDKQAQVVEDLKQGKKLDVKSVKGKREVQATPLALPSPERQAIPKEKVESFEACPFCGTSNDGSMGLFEAYESSSGWFVRCFSCHAEGPLAENRQDATDLWNRRK